MCRGCAGIGSKRRSIVRPRKSFASLWLSGTRSVAGARTTKPFPIKHAARCIGSKALREPKNPKIQNLFEGPETVGFFGFPRAFWFSYRNPKTTIVFFFGFPTEIQKNQGFFGFSPETYPKNKKTQGFLGFPPKIQKNPVNFWISVGKPKKTLVHTGKTKKSKSFGPRRKVLVFWNFGFLFFFGFVVPSAETKNAKIQNFSEGPETFGFFGFPRVFLVFLQKSKNNHSVFLVFQQKSKKTQPRVFLSSNRNPKQTKVFLILRPNQKTKKSRVFWLYT